ncbi:MAG: hypothetical protein V7L11_17730 [Nostoc sp.]|uniref:hypothetical protein n=1 Tax=Nostoc sp. TaxID=1180 RepID=UPI002FF89671
MKASLELAFRFSRSQSPTGNACLWGCRLSLLAAEPLGATFPASGWKRDFKGVSAEVDTN